MVTQLELFGEEIDIKKLEKKDYLKMTIPEKQKLHNYRIEKKKRAKGKDKATITLSYSYFSSDIPEKNIKKGDKFYSVSFWGHNEGSGSPCYTYEEMVKEIQNLKAKYEEKYKITIIDDEKIQYSGLLDKWKGFIVNLCKEKGQEIDKIWFDTSVPLDCEVAVRLKGHRCWNSCVDFRFGDYKLKAYDSHFGGGTSFISCDDEEQEIWIREIMDKVFNKECSNSGWERDDNGHREINIDEKGWRIK